MFATSFIRIFSVSSFLLLLSLLLSCGQGNPDFETANATKRNSSDYHFLSTGIRYDNPPYTSFYLEDRSPKLTQKEKMPVNIIEHPSSKTFVIHLHGGPGGRSQIKAKRLLDQQYNLVYWQQRGSGKSIGPDYNRVTLNKDLMIMDLKQLIIQLKNYYGGDIQIVLYGQSWGASLALHFLQDYPEMVDALISDSGTYDINNSLIKGYQKIINTLVPENESDADEHWALIQEQFDPKTLSSPQVYYSTVSTELQHAHYHYLKQAEYILSYLNNHRYGYEGINNDVNPEYYGFVNWQKAFNHRELKLISESVFFSPKRLNATMAAAPVIAKVATSFEGRGSSTINSILQPALLKNLESTLSTIDVPSYFLYASYDLQVPIDFHQDICERIASNACVAKEYDSPHVVLSRPTGNGAEEDLLEFLNKHLPN